MWPLSRFDSSAFVKLSYEYKHFIETHEYSIAMGFVDAIERIEQHY